MDQEFIDQYTMLLIKQYWEKPKARAEIELLSGTWSDLFQFFESWNDEFDLDSATGDRLDKIGSIVGIGRTADGIAFSDDDYRFFIRLKIANNVVVGTMIDDTRLSIQDVIQFAFSGGAYVVDNYDMTLSLLLGIDVDPAIIERVIRLKLLPKPAAVRYGLILRFFDVMLRVDDDYALALSDGSALRIKFTQTFET
jgi:hypothetical protein